MPQEQPVPADLEKEREEALENQINQILLSGKFEPSPEYPVAKGETIIGKLTPPEKAIFTAAEITAKDHDAMVKIIEALFNKAWEISKDVDVAKMLKSNLRTLRLHKQKYDLLKKRLWEKIRERLREVVFENSIGIREKYQIVILPKDGADSLLFTDILFPDGLDLSPLIMVIQTRNCAICFDYDNCQNPLKKPREQLLATRH